MIKAVIQLYHDSPMSGHAGISDTLDRVKEHYFFQCMGPIITDYVRSCQDCQKRKATKYHTKSGITSYLLRCRMAGITESAMVAYTHKCAEV